MAASRVRRVAALAAVVAGIACAPSSPDAWLRKITPPGADQRARDYLALFTSGRTDSAAALLDSALRVPGMRPALDSMTTLMRGLAFDSVRVIGVQVFEQGGDRRVNMQYELHSGAGWAAANVTTLDSDGAWVVTGARYQPLPRPLEEINRFRLGGASVVHYLWLALMAAALATSVGVALLVALDRRMPKRWRWAFLALLGAGAFTLDWTGGRWAFRPLQVMLFSAAAVRASPVSPWILSFALPIGAALALRHRRRWLAGRLTAAAVAAEVAAGRPEPAA